MRCFKLHMSCAATSEAYLLDPSIPILDAKAEHELFWRQIKCHRHHISSHEQLLQAQSRRYGGMRAR